MSVSLIALLAPRRVAYRTAPERVAVIVGLRSVAMTCDRDRRDIGGAALNGVGGAETQRCWQARPDRARAARALRALEAARRATYTSTVSRSSAGSRAAPANAGATGCASTTTANARTWSGKRRNTVGWRVRPRCRRRLLTARLRRGAPRRESVNRYRLRYAAPPTVYRRHGIKVERWSLTDNGSAYRAAMHAVACPPARAIRHIRTRPYRPQTNGANSRALHPHSDVNSWAYGAILRLEPRTHPRP